MINLKNIRFGYAKEGLLFNGLNLELGSGGIYGLLGKNGAGKSTLLKLISSVIFPASGSVEYMQQNNQFRSKSFLQEVFLLTEDNSKHQISGREYAKIYAEFYPRFDHRKFEDIIGEWEIECRNKLANLSEGERKKFFIAFAIASNCRVLLLDEPTNGLDIPAKAVFRRLIASRANPETTFVISSHQVRDLDGLIDPLIIMDHGKIIFKQSLAEIEEKLIFASGLQLPAERQLFYSVPTEVGTAYVAARSSTDHYGSKVDLELLFNAVIANPQSINQLFGV